MIDFILEFKEDWKNATVLSKMQAVLLFTIFALIIFQPSFAANNMVSPETLFQKIVDLLTGKIATYLAILAVILIGIAAMFGIFDFRRAGYFIIGIIMVFSAAWIVETIVGK